MAKQKMVVKLSLDDAKKRAKALKTTVTMDGVQSVAFDGDKLVVVGDGMDVINLTTSLRRKLGYAELLSVASGEQKKEDKTETKNVEPVIYPYQYSYHFPYVYHDGGYVQKFYSLV